MAFAELDKEKEYWEAFDVGVGINDGLKPYLVNLNPDNFWLVSEDADKTDAPKTFNGTKGWFEITGEAVYYDGMTAPPASFEYRKISSAGGLPATLTDPAIKYPAAGTSNTLTRTIRVEWDCLPTSASKKTVLVKRTKDS